MNNFEKRQWVRLILCALVLIAVSLFLTGIIGGEHMTYNLAEKANGPAVNGKFRLREPVLLADTAPTIADLLGFCVPEIWRGRPALVAK